MGSSTSPADAFLWLTMSAVPALLLIVLFSVLAFRYAKTGPSPKRYLATAHSGGGLLTLGVIGFVIGSLVAGAIGAGVILRNISGAERTSILFQAPPRPRFRTTPKPSRYPSERQSRGSTRTRWRTR